jgi:hypothetical protein
MDDSSSSTIDQTDEDILSDTVSDEALEAAAGTEGGQCLRLRLQRCQAKFGAADCGAGEGSMS